MPVDDLLRQVVRQGDQALLAALAMDYEGPAQQVVHDVVAAHLGYLGPSQPAFGGQPDHEHLGFVGFAQRDQDDPVGAWSRMGVGPPDTGQILGYVLLGPA